MRLTRKTALLGVPFILAGAGVLGTRAGTLAELLPTTPLPAYDTTAPDPSRDPCSYSPRPTGIDCAGPITQTPAPIQAPAPTPTCSAVQLQGGLSADAARILPIEGIYIAAAAPTSLLSVPAETAQQTALAQFPDAVACHHFLAAVTYLANGGTSAPRTDWVFTVASSSDITPHLGTTSVATFLYVLVDASTGAFISGLSGGSTGLPPTTVSKATPTPCSIVPCSPAIGPPGN